MREQRQPVASPALFLMAKIYAQERSIDSTLVNPYIDLAHTMVLQKRSRLFRVADNPVFHPRSHLRLPRRHPVEK